MASIAGKAYYLDDSRPNETKVIKWQKSIKKGQYTYNTSRMLCAALYLESINPTLVDLLCAELNRDSKPNIKSLEMFIKLTISDTDSQNEEKCPWLDPNNNESNETPKDHKIKQKIVHEDDGFNDLKG